MLGIEYNSQKDELIIPEYGRNVQLLLRRARGIENIAERQAYVEEIVGLMLTMNPQTKNLDDYRDRLWKHAFRIAEYDLPGVMPPNGEIPTPENVRKKPEKVGYLKNDTQFRHYGNNVKQLIKKAMQMEEGPVRDGFVNAISSYMKLAYRTWSKEHYISDEAIKNDLNALSQGVLKMDEESAIENFNNGSNNSLRNVNQNSNNNNNKRKFSGGDNRNKNYGNNNNNNNRNNNQNNNRKK